VAESAEGTTTIKASASEIMEVIADFDAYPDWSDVKSTDVVKSGSDGRASEVAYVIEAPMIGEAHYTLKYSWHGDDGVSWTTSETDGKLKDITGEYVLEELDEDETKVTYRISADLSLKIPGFLKKQGQKQVVRNALDGLKKRVGSTR
jgi:hypothetical protein